MVNLTTIEYDLPVKNLIAGLNATGHITHGNYHKTGVTFHHNGGGPDFSHQDILNIWKTRAASAHFDVDGKGSVCQYANAYDYAWACANARGNETTISIELANATLAPNWLVSETTWRAGARLAGWLFANIIGEAPTASNIYFHHDWYPTACAGPHMDSVRGDLVDAVQAAYRLFKDGKTPTPPKSPTPPPKKKSGKLAVDGDFGTGSTKALQRLAGTTVDGVISGQAETEKPYHHNLLTCQYVGDAKGSQVIAWLQKKCGAKADGLFGPGSIKALQRKLGIKADGYFGPATAKALQKAINGGDL